MSEPFDKNKSGNNLSNTGVYDFENRYKEMKYNDDIAQILKNTKSEASYQDEIAGVLKTANREAERNKARAAARRKARKKRIITRLTIVIVAFLLVLAIVIFGIVSAVKGIIGLFGGSKDASAIAQLVSSADVAAAGYDYDGAIEIIKSYGEKYDKKKELEAAVLKYENEKTKLVKFEDNTKIPHLSFRTLIYDTSKAFDTDDSAAKYDRNMVTVTEFSKILEELYSRGFVLVDINDIAKEGSGAFSFCDIYLPEGKTPLVLSQEDVSYYESLEGDGFASKIIIGEDGSPLCEYTDENGNITTGAFDLVPILEDFIKKHPDFSYKGARATLAVTGYDGVLGYRTNPDSENYQEGDAEKATSVANRLKELGYTFASNSWAYTSYGNNSTERLITDADRWENEVEPIVGSTNVLIFAGGADIVQSGEYKEDNEKFQYLKSKGFNVFCPVNANQSSVTMGTDYLRQGRRLVGGNELYYSADKLADLFDANGVLDIARPTQDSEVS